MVNSLNGIMQLRSVHATYLKSSLILRAMITVSCGWTESRKSWASFGIVSRRPDSRCRVTSCREIATSSTLYPGKSSMPCFFCMAMCMSISLSWSLKSFTSRIVSMSSNLQWLHLCHRVMGNVWEDKCLSDVKLIILYLAKL